MKRYEVKLGPVTDTMPVSPLARVPNVRLPWAEMLELEPRAEYRGTLSLSEDHHIHYFSAEGRHYSIRARDLHFTRDQIMGVVADIERRDKVEFSADQIEDLFENGLDSAADKVTNYLRMMAMMEDVRPF